MELHQKIFSIHLICLTFLSAVRGLQSNVYAGIRKFRISDMAEPAFCNSLDCPEFRILKRTKDYEERLYKESSWVSTSMTGMDYDAARRPMFMRLFNYISGKNERKQKIAMTAPVINRIIPGQGPACENNFTMSFFVAPSEGQPPQPSDRDVFLSKLPQQKVYVVSYGGYSDKSKMLAHAEQLSVALSADNKTFRTDHYFTAGYDSPFKIFNRHNEIWFIAQ